MIEKYRRYVSHESKNKRLMKVGFIAALSLFAIIATTTMVHMINPTYVQGIGDAGRTIHADLIWDPSKAACELDPPSCPVS